jgi:ribosome-binding ATPase
MLIGFVGKPSVGKSSFFKAATLAEVEIANYPFTTIKPNHATGYTKVECVDKEFNRQCNPRAGYCVQHYRFVPIDLLDVAGLVPGAHEGEGMGSQFLDDLNQADALIHVIDISGSTNEKGESVEAGKYDPAEDIKFLDHELNMWYLRILKKGWEKFIRQQKAIKGDVYKSVAKQCSGLRVTEEIAKFVLLKLGLPDDLEKWSEEDIFNLAQELRRQTKPMIIAANKVDIGTGKNNFDRIVKKFPDLTIIPCSAISELALKEAAKKRVIDYVPGEETFIVKGSISEQQKKGLDYIKNNVLDIYSSTGIQNAIDKVVFELLNMITIFPGGAKLEDKDGNCLPDCFLLKKGSTALDFAFSLHTDIGNGFIRAIDIKTKRTVGKDHLLHNRDVIEIITRA